MVSQKISYVFFVVLLTSIGFSVNAMGSRPNKNEANESTKSVKLPEPSIFGREGFSKIVAPLLPAVVNISTSKDVKIAEMEVPDLPPDSPFADLFKHFFKEFGRRQRPQKSRSLGSGFIIHYDSKTKEALVVTNNHIILEADEILVRLHGDENIELKAEVVGSDIRTDIALLKIKSAKPLSTVLWGDSSKAKVGEWSIAVGNPFGLGSTVTAGIISTKGRELPIADYVEGYLQTDAPINMGNSGGPLFNIEGEVIGINTAILAPTGGNIGIGFSIPSNIAQKVITQLRDLGHTRRGFLGAAVQKVSKDIAESVGLKKAYGALIAKVYKESPAEKAGLKRGDIILKFNDKEVKSSHFLPRIVGETEIDQEVSVLIWRNEAEMTKKIVVGEFEKAEKEGLIEPKTLSSKKTTKKKGLEVMGMTLKSPESLDERTRTQYKLDKDTKGVVIIDLDIHSRAAEIGFQTGDVISEVNRQEVKRPEDVKSHFDQARSKGRKSVLILINRRGEFRFVPLTLENKSKSQKDDLESPKNKLDESKDKSESSKKVK